MIGGTKQLICVALLAVSAMRAGVADAAQKPQVVENGLTVIVARFEAVGCQIVNASFDDGRWELGGYRGDLPFELAVDHDTGKLVSIRRNNLDALPPTGAKPLSQILNEVTSSGCTRIVSVGLEHGHWKVGAYRGLDRRKLHLDPISGVILTERID